MPYKDKATYKEYQKAYQREWKRKQRLINPEYVQKNKDRCSRYYHSNPERAKDDSLGKRYGITIKERDEMFRRQGSKCGLCGSLTPQSKKGWMVDHCHTTGSIRGVLCHPCNTMLGQAHDNPRILEAAIHYLKLAELIG